MSEGSVTLYIVCVRELCESLFPTYEGSMTLSYVCLRDLLSFSFLRVRDLWLPVSCVWGTCDCQFPTWEGSVTCCFLRMKDLWLSVPYVSSICDYVLWTCVPWCLNVRESMWRGQYVRLYPWACMFGMCAPLCMKRGVPLAVCSLCAIVRSLCLVVYIYQRWAFH
jgi:hypothetical protein